MAETIAAKHFGIDEGLSQSAVSDIVKGPKGYYWFATQDGLNRFDGYQFKIYNKSNTPSFNNNFITSVEQFGSESLLVGTEKGLYILNVVTELLTQVVIGSQEQGVVNDIYVIPEGILVSLEQKLYLLPGNLLNTNTQNRFNPLPLNEISTVTGRSIFNLDGDLFYLSENKKLRPVFSDRDLPKWYQLIADAPHLEISYAISTSSQILLATRQGLFKISGNSLTNISDIKNISVMSLDSTSRLWFAATSGLYRMESPLAVKSDLIRIHTQTNERNTLSGNVFLAFYALPNGVVWIGTQNNGVALYSPTSDWFTNYSIFNDTFPLTSDNILAIKITDKSTWISSATGVTEYKNSDYRIYNSNNQSAFLSDRVTKIEEDENKTVWFGFYGGAIAYKEQGRSDFIALDVGDNNLHVSDMLVSGNLLYVSTRNQGLHIVNTKTKQVESIESGSENGLTTKRLQSLFKSKDNFIWVGSFDSGVFKYDEQSKQFEPLSSLTSIPLQGLENAIVTDFYEESNNLWVSTSNGLYQIDWQKNEMSVFDEKSGLLNETVYTIIPDQFNKLWLPTNKGVVELDPTTKFFKTFSKNDGFINNEYNANAFFKTSKGEIWLGGVAGFTIIAPALKSEVLISDAVSLSDLTLFNQRPSKATSNKVWQESNKGTKLTLEPEMSMFTLFFTTFQPELANRTMYRYKMEDFNAKWVTTQPGKNEATYTNLSYGRHQLLVRASTNGFDWSPITSIEIEVLPPLWLTTTAKISYFAIVIIILSVFINQSVSRRKFEMASFKNIKEKEERLRLSMKTSGNILWELDFESNSLTVIDYQNEDLTPKKIDYTESELAKLVHPNDAKKLTSKLTKKSKVEDLTQRFLFQYRDNQGEYQWMKGSFIVKKVNANANVRLVIGISHNVDELIKTKDALQDLNQDLEKRVKDRTTRLNKTNKELKITLDNLQFTQGELVESQKMASLGGMVAGISHEVNTPLGVCVTALSHLSSKLSRVNSKFESKQLTSNDLSEFLSEGVTSVDLLSKNIDRATHLINSFKQVSVDQSSEELRAFNLHETLSDSFHALSPKFKEKKITFSIDCSEDINMNSYPGAISQIILNLVMNSITHGFSDSNQGHISIEVSEILDEYDEVLLIYSDNGKGISESNLQKVFDPFFTSNRGGGNTGLGMHITYNLIVQKLKGAIAVNSLIDTGAEFYIRLSKNLK